MTTLVHVTCQLVNRIARSPFAIVLVFGVMLGPLQAIAEQPRTALSISLEVRFLKAGTVTNTTILSRDQLSERHLKKITTTTPWTEGLQDFEGVPLKSLIQKSTENAQVRLSALNDYTVTLPASELNDEYPIVAFRRNGKELSVRERGPFWIIYPFDQPKFKSEKYFAQSVWQLKDIEIILQ